VKIYVAAMEVLRKKKERQDETQFTTKIDGFLGNGGAQEKGKVRMKLSLPPKLMVF
jgi:hypothetical protein